MEDNTADCLEKVVIRLSEIPPHHDLLDIRKSFEAGGTKIWGIDFDDSTDMSSDYNSLTPIREDDCVSAYQNHERMSYLDAASIDSPMSASPHMRRRQSEFRTGLLRHRQLWQRAAKQVNLGTNLKAHRRQSILPIETISGESEVNDEEESAVGKSENRSIAVPVNEPFKDPYLPIPPRKQIKTTTSNDIKRTVEPEMRAAYEICGFLFPRLPTVFTNDVNETLYQRYYSIKKKTAALVMNIFYIILLLCLWILSLIPLRKSRDFVLDRIVMRESIYTGILILLHISAILIIKMSKSERQVRYASLFTWVLLILESVKLTIASFVDENSANDSWSAPWVTTALWQTAITLFITFHFLSVIPLKLSIILSATTLVLHLVLMGVVNGLHNVQCIARLGIDLVILASIFVTGVFNHYTVERSERKAFLEIRTCIEFRHLVAEENQSQERLVLSVLPKFIVNEINNTIDGKGTQSNFYSIYLQRFENVSILFADICGFTTLGSQLEPKELVNVLNDLFANFDKLAKKHKCLRIKLLGDCYESVCGIPERRIDHADNCVKMGLDMIDSIRLVREQQKVNVLDMRIGVHSGSVFCGVLGLKKWQFDIYSDDVKTANMMESSGEKGRVHISETTMDNLTQKFEGIVLNENRSNNYIKTLGIRTYFIDPPKEAQGESDHNANKGMNNTTVVNGVTIVKPANGHSRKFERRMTAHSLEQQESIIGCEYTSKIPQPLRSSTDTSLNKMIEKATDSQSESLVAEEHITKTLVTFKQPDMESKYCNVRDDGFQTNLLSFSLIVLSILCTQIASTHSLPELSWVSPMLIGFVLTSTICMIVCSSALIRKLIRYIQAKKSHVQDTECAHDVALNAMIPSSFTARNTIVSVLIFILFLSSLFKPIYVKVNDSYHITDCFKSYVWISWLLVLLATASFLHWLHVVKVVAIIVMTTTYVAVNEACSQSPVISLYFNITFNNTLPSQYEVERHLLFYERVEYLIVLMFAMVLLIYHSRVSEFHSRLDFLWRLQAKQELDEMDSLKKSNNILLSNILPEHVANHFLQNNRRNEELYSESYDNVAVMFAAISNFNEFWLAVPGNEEGRGCLRILNEIIGDFDELLSLPAFIEVEKIKTIGYTYMTCVGLSPVRKHENNIAENLKTCCDLAFAMQESLEELNNNGFGNNFQLRIGINHGPVVAGVIGAKKPHYDIWGHTVNLASRMESNSMPGKIQVMEKTARVLQRNGYLCDYRSTMPIKGLSEPQRVYFVHKPEPTRPPMTLPSAVRKVSMALNENRPTFDKLVTSVLKNPSLRRKLKADRDAARKDSEVSEN